MKGVKFFFFPRDSCDTLIFGHLREFCGVRLVRWVLRSRFEMVMSLLVPQ